MVSFLCEKLTEESMSALDVFEKVRNQIGFGVFLVSSCFLALPGCQVNTEKGFSIEMPKRPNIIVILTDQERHIVHWPDDFAEENLPSLTRLKKNGLTFHKAYTAACECTPSRAVITTSEHYPINKVPRTPSVNGLPSVKELMDIGSLLKSQTDYEVVWKGKWHLSPPLKGGHDWIQADIPNVEENYDIFEWNPPDAGTAISELVINPNGTKFDGLSTLGGGYANNDGRFVQGVSKDQPKQTAGFGESILDYLKKVGGRDVSTRKPFCLFISLVNPHDVWVYPNALEASGYKKEDFISMGIDLPSNQVDDLKTKPSVQLKAREAFQKASPLKGVEEQLGYVNFYAYVNKVVDGQIQTILDALDSYGLTEDTVIIRTADHGELGLSHGMREKAYTVYEETIHIPFIVSNPKMYPSPKQTNAFYCHLDLLPTLAEIAQVPDFSRYGKGVSVVPVLKDPSTSVQDSILFTYDDVFFLPENTPGGHIRAIRTGDFVYAVYYSEDGSSFEYEMYNLKNDPGELNNLLYQNKDPKVAKEAKRLHDKLKEKIDAESALLPGFPWPKAPAAL